jgi:hypothetical protein
MDQKRYEVEITFRQTLRFAVDAASRRGAEREAMDLWQAGDEEAVVGSECCELVEVRTQPIPCDDRCQKDAEDVYRYLRDRELVIETLDEDAFNPTIHDAVSAEEVAIHQGWKRRGDGVDGLPDTARAARALDRLCDERRVVCFTRERMRLGERGEIRLYCTPQHLALLSALVLEDVATAGAPA